MHECLRFTIIRLLSPSAWEAILHWKESGWNLNVSIYFFSSSVSATFFAVKFCGKAFTEISSAVHLSSISPTKLLFGSILGVKSFSLLPPVNAKPSKNGLTTHVLRDGGCFHFYPLFKQKKKWRELRNWRFKNWWVRLRMACGEEWRYEWANGERRVERTGCAVVEPNLTAFLSVWVEAADATSTSP